MQLSEHVTVLTGDDGGRYPDGNAVLVRGGEETALIDPTLTIAAMAAAPHADRVLITHAHEDHLAGAARYRGHPIHVHQDDAIGLHGIDGLLTMYGMDRAVEAQWRDELLTRFHYVPRPDARTFADGHVFELGGGVRIRAIHLPGHTRGHTGFFVEPDEVMVLADVDLTGFGPYYGDAWSSLDDWDRTLQRCRTLEARSYVTFHHKGVIAGRDAFLTALADYAAVIPRRERALLDYLATPRTIGELVAHRFVYRPHVQLLFADSVERRSAELHLARLIGRGEVRELASGRYVRD